MSHQRILCLFRDHDLRISDNPALHHALREAKSKCAPLYLLYCVEPQSQKTARSTWLTQHLVALAQDIHKLGGTVTYTDPESLLKRIALHHITSVHWNRRYTPDGITKDSQLKSALIDSNIAVRSHKASLLFEPFDPQTHNKQGEPYKVYTPFARNLLPQCRDISAPLPAPHSLADAKASIGDAIIAPTSLQPWQHKLLKHWTIGEAQAKQQHLDWLESGFTDYHLQRDIPSNLHGTSLLSPWLSIGTISPRQIVHDLIARYPQYQDNPDLLTFVKEMLWREFAHHILYHYQETIAQPFQSKFNRFHWRSDEESILSLKRWQQGETGIPIVDAGMRQLWATGWMHNRVRMLVASYLCKNLLIHWHHGAQWFMNTLIDADLASNTMGWQWVAGCGVDAAPYFRIFNPLTQAQKYDPQAQYLKRWLPELQSLTPKQCFTPWAHCKHYPEPEIDLKASREAALETFKRL